jgi:D-threo-aldose 1-dehydrogenase
MIPVMGCAALGGLYRPVTEAEAHETLAAAWDRGIRVFDTAPHYGAGQSEEYLGAFLRSKPRDSYILSTKVGRLLVDDPDAVDGTEGFYGTPARSRIRDYSADGVRRSLEESLARLGLDRVDLVLIHDPEDHLQQAVEEAAPALAALRDETVIGGFGVGTNFTDVAHELVHRTDLDTVMIAGRYTLLDRRSETLLRACAERDVAVLVAGVLNSGLLADPRPGARFNYEPAPEWIVAAALRMSEACERYGVPLRAAALRFPLRHPVVRSVVVGPGRVTSVHDTLAQLCVTIPQDLWDELDTLVPDQDRLP